MFMESGGAAQAAFVSSSWLGGGRQVHLPAGAAGSARLNCKARLSVPLHQPTHKASSARRGMGMTAGHVGEP